MAVVYEQAGDELSRCLKPEIAAPKTVRQRPETITKDERDTVPQIAVLTRKVRLHRRKHTRRDPY
jgi:hypothetical protein